MTSGNEMVSRALTRADARPTSRREARARGARAPKTTRWSRRQGVVSAFAAFAAIGFVAAYVGPTGAALAQAGSDDSASSASISLYASAVDDAQAGDVGIAGSGAAAPALDRGSYSVYVAPKIVAPAPAADTASGSGSGGGGWQPPFVSPDPGSAQAIAYGMVQARGWGDDQFACLVALWNRESGWRVNAYNSSGAYGIPQALPGSKMSSAGPDWETNPATQIAWGLGYIGGRYGTPCGAWDHSQSSGWY